MINYQEILEQGSTRAAFNLNGAYFEIPINNVPEEDIQQFLQSAAEDLLVDMEN